MSLVFGVIFWLTEVPVYLAFIFGGIALATAPGAVTLYCQRHRSIRPGDQYTDSYGGA